MSSPDDRELDKIKALLEINNVDKDSLLYQQLLGLEADYHGFRHANDCIRFLPHMKMEYPRLASKVVLGFRGYPEAQGIRQFVDLQEVEFQKYLALALVTESIESLSWGEGLVDFETPVVMSRDGGCLLSEGALKDLILERPDDAPSIVQIVKERRIFEAEHIVALIEASGGKENVLGNGAL